jgi:hypothetical protein
MGKNVLLPILSVVPFLQSSFMIFFNFTPVPTSSEVFTTTINGVNYTSGLGTHIIGDLYYTFGLPGVVLLMLILGITISLLTNKVLIKGKQSMYSLIALSFLVGNSVYSVRVEYFFILRLISLTLIVFCCIDLLTRMLFPVPRERSV